MCLYFVYYFSFLGFFTVSLLKSPFSFIFFFSLLSSGLFIICTRQVAVDIRVSCAKNLDVDDDADRTSTFFAGLHTQNFISCG